MTFGLGKIYSVFDLPGPEFDPFTASIQVLEKFGVPARPDPRLDPGLFSFWKQLVQTPLVNGKPLPFSDIVSAPEFVPGEEQHWLRAQLLDTSSLPPVFVQRGHALTSQNWSGAAVSPPLSKRFVAVYGSWIVPRVSLPDVRPIDAEASGARASVWVGLDGYRSRFPRASMPQIGTLQRTDSGGTFAWWEWWHQLPDGHIPSALKFAKTNFEVAAGDEILAGLYVVPTTEDVVFFIKNQRTYQYRSFMALRQAVIEAAGGVDVEPLGSTAEWIVERPTTPNTGQLAALPDFGRVDFRYCFAQAAVKSMQDATTSTHTLDDNGRFIDMREMFADPARVVSASRARRSAGPDETSGVTCTYHGAT